MEPAADARTGAVVHGGLRAVGIRRTQSGQQPNMTESRTVVDTPARALRHVQLTFPALDARRAAHIEDTWATRAYMIDDTWLFRFPRTDNAERLYRKERALLPRLAPRVDVAVANIECVGTLPDGRMFMGHRAIVGEPLTLDAVRGMSSAGRSAVAGQIGAFLRALHSFPPDDARDVGVELDDRCLEGALVLDNARRDLFPLLTTKERELTEGVFSMFLDDAANFGFERRLTHMDMRGRHILMDQTPRVAGIIDYGSTCISDANYDFFPLVLDFGEAFAREALAAYGHPDPDRAVRNAPFYCAMDALACWVDCLGDGFEKEAGECREYHRKALDVYARQTAC